MSLLHPTTKADAIECARALGWWHFNEWQRLKGDKNSFDPRGAYKQEVLELMKFHEALWGLMKQDVATIRKAVRIERRRRRGSI